MEATDTKQLMTLDWWTVREVAQHFRLSVTATYGLLADKPAPGKLLARKIGGSWRVHRSAIAEFEAEAIPKEKRERERIRIGTEDALGRKAKPAA